MTTKRLVFVWLYFVFVTVSVQVVFFLEKKEVFNSGTHVYFDYLLLIVPVWLYIVLRKEHEIVPALVFSFLHMVWMAFAALILAFIYIQLVTSFSWGHML